MSIDHPFQQPLHLGDLVLRPAGWEHVMKLMEIWDDPSLAWMFPNAYDGSDPDPSFLLEVATGHVARQNLLVVEEEGNLIGTVHLNGFRVGKPSLGWYVAPEHRRRDVATRAVGAALTHLFESGYETIGANMDPRNDACRGLLEKLGFRPVPGHRPDLLDFETTPAEHAARAAAEPPAMRPAA